MKKIMLLGSGELGKEFVIAAKRLGQFVIAVDSYNNAPAQQLADERVVINMLDGEALDRIVEQYQPDIIIPEIEAIRTERFYGYEKSGIQVVPSAKAANFTMNRKAIRDLAAMDLGIRTAKYNYASSEEELVSCVGEIGLPCVVKPLMSSSGKGQSIVHHKDEIQNAWLYAQSGKRGDYVEVIVEELINFNTEITLLTVTQKNAPTLFCKPIGHRQERGDYQESWQPAQVKSEDIDSAQEMAGKITTALGGEGIWGVEFFLTDNGVYFSELSPRPHDTGMVTLANTQNFSQFELHARAVLGLPIPEIIQKSVGASAVILAKEEGEVVNYIGIAEALTYNNSDVRIFGKEISRKYRRMGVALANGEIESDVEDVVEQAVKIANCVQVENK